MITLIFIALAPFLPLIFFPSFLLALAYMFELRGLSLSLPELIAALLIGLVMYAAGKPFVLSLSYGLSLWLAMRLSLDEETLSYVLGKRKAYMIMSLMRLFSRKLLLIYYTSSTRGAGISYTLARMLSYIVDKSQRKALTMALRFA